MATSDFSHRAPSRAPGSAAAVPARLSHPLRPVAALVIASMLALVITAVGVPARAEPASPTLEGELLEVSIETESGGEDGEGQVIVSEDGEVTEVEGEAVEDIESGATVEATVETETEDSAAVVEEATVIAAAEETAAVSAHHAYVVTIDDANASGDVPLADAVDNAEFSAAYWLREARGAISGFDIAGSTTMTYASSCSASYSTLWSAAAAQFPGVSFSGSGNHLIVYTPDDCSYSYAGVATVGNLSKGGYVHIASLGTATTVHELGHNLGLGHANALWGDPYGDYGYAEYYGAYGPQAATISSYPSGGLDAAYRAYLDLPGWESQTETLVASSEYRETTTVTLTDTTSSTGTTAIALDNPDDGSEYFLELRTGTGVDASTFYAQSWSKLSVQGYIADYDPGIVVTWVTGDNDLQFLATEDGTSLWTSYQAGETFASADGLFEMTVVSISGSTATVEVTTSPALPEAAAPVASTTSVDVPETVYEGVAAEATVTVSSSATVTGEVDVYVDDAFYSTAALTGGEASLDLDSSLALGTHEVRAVYDGTASIVGSESTSQMTVVEGSAPETAASTTSVSATTVYQGTSSKATVTVTSTETVTGAVDVYVDGIKRTTAALSGGSVQVTLPSSLSVGSHDVRAVYLGSDAVAGSQATTTLTVKAKIATSVSVSATSPYAGTSAVLSVTVSGAVGGTVRATYGSKSWSATVSSSGKATITLPSTWSAATRTVTVAYLGTSTRAASSATVKVTVKAVPTFVDVSSSSPFKAEITWLATSGVSQGWTTSSGTQFRPTISVNRDVMAAFLYRFAGSPDYTPPSKSPFTDVSTSHVFYKEIAWLASTGVTTGWKVSGGYEFRPSQAVNRDVMAAFLYRFAGSPSYTPPARSPFTDVSTSHVFYKEIAWLASTGVSEGWKVSGGYEFRTTTSVKRDVMAAFLYRFDSALS